MMNKYTKAVLVVVASTLISGCAERWEAVSSKQFRTVPSTPWPYSTKGQKKVYFEFMAEGVDLNKYSRVTCENPFGIASEYLPKVSMTSSAGFWLYKNTDYIGGVIVDHITLANHLELPEIEVMRMSTEDVIKELGDHENCKGIIDTRNLPSGQRVDQSF